jgi:hypothetical protein
MNDEFTRVSNSSFIIYHSSLKISSLLKIIAQKELPKLDPLRFYQDAPKHQDLP